MAGRQSETAEHGVRERQIRADMPERHADDEVEENTADCRGREEHRLATAALSVHEEGQDSDGGEQQHRVAKGRENPGDGLDGAVTDETFTRVDSVEPV